MSSMVDERVVSMSFDNSKFDKNVQQSVDSINNLKSSLNFDESKTSFKNLSKSANSIDLSGIEKSLTKLNQRFSAFGIAGTQVITNLTNHAMGMAKKSMNWLTQGVIQGGINRAKNIQQAKFQLKGLGVEWEEISENIDYAVNGTAYGMDSAAKAASQLVASNVKLGDSMRTALRGISGLAAMTNSSYDDMARIFTTVAGNGRLMGDQLNQISARGINAAATLAKHLGKSEKEIRDMVSRGKIDFATFAEAMDSAFGEHAKEANITFQGAMSNVRAALGRIGELFVTPLIEDNGPLVRFFNTLRLVIDNIKKASAEVSGTFLRPIIKSINKATQWMRNLYHVTGNTFERYGNIIHDAGGSADEFQKKVEKNLKKQGIDVDKLTKKYGGLKEGLNHLKSEVRGDVLTKAFMDSEKAFMGDDSALQKVNLFMRAYEKATDGKAKIDKEGIASLKKQGYEYDKLKGILDKYKKYYDESHDDMTEVMAHLTKEELKGVGANREAIKTLQHMKQSAKMAGMDLSTYYENLLNIEEHGSGGVLILKTIKNLITAIIRPLSALGKAFMNVFGIKNNEVAIYNLIYSIEQFSEKLIMSDETVEMLTKTFELFFTIIKWGAKLIGGALFVALKIVGKVLSSAGTGLLEITSDIDSVKKRVEDLVGPILSKAVKKVKELIELVKPLGGVLLKLLSPLNRIKSVINAYLIDNGLLNALLQWGSIILRNHTEGVKKWLDTMNKSKVLEDVRLRLKLLLVLFNKLFGEGPKRIRNFLDTIKSLNNANILDVVKLQQAFKKDILDYFFDMKKWKAVGSFAWNIVKALFNAIRDKIVKIDYKGLGKGLLGGMKTLFSMIGDKAKSIDYSKWGDVGHKILEGLLEGLKSGSFSLFKVMGGIGDNLLAVIKGVLGIHSPSTKAIEIGKNIILGLVKGLKGGLGEIIAVVKYLFGSVGKSVPKFAKNLFVIIAAFKMLSTVAVLIKGLKSLAAPLYGISELMGSMTKVQNQMAKNLKAAVWVEYAIAISLFADAVIKLSKMSLKEAAIGLGSLIIILGAFYGISLALSKINDKELAAKLAGMTAVVVALGWFLMKASVAFFLLGRMSLEKVRNASIALGALMAAITIMALISKKLVGGDKSDLVKAEVMGKMMSEFGKSLLILADAMRKLGRLKPKVIGQASLIILGYLGVISALIAVANAGEELTGLALAATLMGFSTSLILLAIGIRALGTLDYKYVKHATPIILCYAAVVGILSALVSKYGGTAAAAGFVMMGFSAALVILAIGIKKLGSLNGDEIDAAMAVIAKFGKIVVMVMLFTTFASNAAKSAVIFIAFAASLVILAKGISMLSGLSEEQADRALKIVEKFSGIAIAMVILSSICGKYGLQTGIMILSMAGAMLVLAAACAIMAMIDPQDLARVTVALTVLMLAFAAVMFAAGQIDGSGFKSLIVLAVAMGELMAAMVILAKEDYKSVISAGAAITGVMLSMTAIVAALGHMKTGDFKKAQGSVLLIIELVGALSGAISLVAQFPADQTIAAGAAMSGAILAFAGSMFIISKISDKMTVAMLKIAGVFAIVMAVILGVMYALDKLDINPSTEAINNIIKLLATFTLMTGALALIGPLAVPAAQGAAALIAVVGVLALGVMAIGGLMELIPRAEEFIDKGVSVLVRLARGFGEIIGAIFDGMMTQATENLPTVAEKISSFAEKLLPFFDSISKIDKESISSVKDLASAMTTFSGLEKTLSSESGGSDLTAVIDEMKSIASGLTDFADELNSLDEKTVSKVKNAALAAKAIGEFAQSIPNTGGGVSFLTGDNDISEFAAKLPDFASDLADAAEALKPIDENAAERIRNAASAARALADMAKAIPNEGGVWGWLAGDNNIADFGSKLESFGSSLSTFSGSVKDVDAESVKNAASASKALVTALNEVDFDPAKILTLSSGVSGLGSGLSDFYGEVSVVDVGKLAAFDLELKALVGILGSMANTNFEGAGSFKKALSDIADSALDKAMNTISGYKDKFSKAIGELFSSISSTAKNSGKGVNFGSSFKTALKSALKTINGYKDNFSKAGSNVAKAFSKGFNNSKVSIGSGIRTSLKNCVSTINGYKDNFSKAGAGVSSAFSKGFNNKKSSIGSSIKTALKNCKSMIDGYKDNFSSAGANLAKGFASGIENNSWRATNAGRSIAKAAYNAAKRELDEHSPSKVMMEVGKFFTEGFANGIANSSGEAIDSAKGVAKSTMSYVLQAVGEINSMMDENLNYQPVIAPVVDTSALSSDLSNIDSSLNSSYAFGLGATINVRNKSMEDMASTIVNGVKNAVGDLIDNAPTPVYTFESPLYIDGREVARSTAAYTQEELDKIQARNNRQMGIL